MLVFIYNLKGVHSVVFLHRIRSPKLATKFQAALHASYPARTTLQSLNHSAAIQTQLKQI